MSRMTGAKRKLAARARFRADVPTLFDRLPANDYESRRQRERKAIAETRRNRLAREAAERPINEAAHRAKLEMLLATATKTPGPRCFTTPAGHLVELAPGQHYEPFRKMTEEQYRSLPLKLAVIAPRCSGCNRWATWDMLVPVAA